MLNLYIITQNMEETKTYVITRESIQKSPPNSIDIANNEESYANYFKLGGTVAKMTVVTAHKYNLYKQKIIEERNSTE